MEQSEHPWTDFYEIWCQYSETNVMHFLFNLLRIKGLENVPSITCSSSGDALQAALGILRACYVSWLHQVHGQQNMKFDVSVFSENLPRKLKFH
jgi:hypothetical protein